MISKRLCSIGREYLLAKLMAHFAPKSVGGLDMGAIRLATSIMLKSTCAGKSRTKFIFYTMDI